MTDEHGDGRALLEWFDGAIEQAKGDQSPSAEIRWLEEGRALALRVLNTQDHERLLRKYIEYVGFAEGTDFITSVDRRHEAGVEFTEAEWSELTRLAEETDAK